MSIHANLRASAPFAKTHLDLGPLTELPGIWIGTGFNLISLPDFDSRPPSTGPKDFRLKLNATREILEFKTIGAPVPNRGVVSAPGSTTGQPDINLFGVTYLQRVNDLVTSGALHIEPGIWLTVPATTVFPVQGATVVRLATIPHGDSLLAQGESFDVTTPVINAVSSTPINATTGTPLTDPTYLAPFTTTPLPPGVPVGSIANPNLVLTDAIKNQTIINTTVLSISTTQAGGIQNIPFVVKNANAIQLDAIFWIEIVKQPDGSTFLQLQYTQTVLLNFLGINWPHISVATLVKQ